MTSASEIVVTYVIPGFGAFLSILMSSVSIPAVYRAAKQHDKDRFDVLPYTSLLGFSFSNIIYGTVINYNPFIFWNGLYGVVASGWLIMNVYSLMTNEKRKMMAQVHVVLILSILGGISYSFGYVDQYKRQKIASSLVDVNAVIFFLSPLNIRGGVLNGNDILSTRSDRSNENDSTTNEPKTQFVCGEDESENKLTKNALVT
eukprot:Pgem_evm1s4715